MQYAASPLSSRMCHAMGAGPHQPAALAILLHTVLSRAHVVPPNFTPAALMATCSHLGPR